jgi:hypothetical protein
MAINRSGELSIEETQTLKSFLQEQAGKTIRSGGKLFLLLILNFAFHKNKKYFEQTERTELHVGSK